MDGFGVMRALGEELGREQLDRDRALVRDDGPFCSACGAALEWVDGPQWSGWRAPELEGKLRDVCYRAVDRTWMGHRP